MYYFAHIHTIQYVLFCKYVLFYSSIIQFVTCRVSTCYFQRNYFLLRIQLFIAHCNVTESEYYLYICIHAATSGLTCRYFTNKIDLIPNRLSILIFTRCYLNTTLLISHKNLVILALHGVQCTIKSWIFWSL